MHGIRAFAVLVVVCGALLSVGGAGATGPYTCAGGLIAPGTYGSIHVVGNCWLSKSSHDSVTVQAGINIAKGASLNAITESALNVGANIVVEPGATLGLGCSPSIGCSFTTSDRVGGSIIGEQPLGLVIHSSWIGGSVSSNGGGGGVSCDTPSPLPIGAPAYSTLEDNTIGAGLTFSGYQSCWLGFFRNTVHGNMTISHNTLADPDATEVANNMVFGNLGCFDNSPHAQFGDSGGGPNTVTGTKTGECAAL
jgi:hypothetical protein